MNFRGNPWDSLRSNLQTSCPFCLGQRPAAAKGVRRRRRNLHWHIFPLFPKSHYTAYL